MVDQHLPRPIYYVGLWSGKQVCPSSVWWIDDAAPLHNLRMHRSDATCRVSDLCLKLALPLGPENPAFAIKMLIGAQNALLGQNLFDHARLVDASQPFVETVA